MPRPRKCRRVNSEPNIKYFKPTGIPLRDLLEVYLPLDGFEAIRLADFEGLSQEEAAEKMSVSRQTFGRILGNARQTVARALVEGIALKIHGGEYSLDKKQTDCGTGDVFTGLMTEENGNGYSTSSGIRADIKECLSMKKIAITSEGPGLSDLVDPRFGRAAGFIIVDIDTMDTKYMDNGACQARSQGAGIQAAETIANAGVEAVLTGYVGPKAFQVLAAAGVKIAQDLDGKTVSEAVELFKKGEVLWADAKDAKGPRK